ncbi:hypothetical protein ACQY0O_006872 [Thecaphora frezii]
MADASMQSTKPSGSRGANPNTDYKVHYLKCKDKFDRVTAEQEEFRTNIAKASQKQQKLRDEINFLLDAIAAKQTQKAAESIPYSRMLSASPASRDPALIYSSAASNGQAGVPRSYAIDHSHAYRHESTPSARTISHHEHAAPVHRPHSPASAAAGGYKRPRPASADPEELGLRAAEVDVKPDYAYREPKAARTSYEDADLQGSPALKRTRNL